MNRGLNDPMLERHAEHRAVSPNVWGGFMPRPAVMSSDDRSWKHLTLRRFQHVPACFEAPALDHHLVTFFLGGESDVDMRLNGELKTGRVKPGKVLIMGAGQENTWRWTGSPDVLHAYLPTDYVAALALELGLYDVELVDGIDLDDPILFDFGRQLAVELETRMFGDDLAGEAFAQLLGLRLMRNHAARRATFVETNQALPPWRLKRVLDAIDDRLDGSISLDDLAAVAGLSKYHFARSFKAATGMPPHRFVLERRVRRAKTLLGDPDLTIAEVALASGFASQEHLTSSFRRLLDTTPARYRRDITL